MEELIRTSRRDFLIKSGWAAVGLTVLASCSTVRGVIPALPSFDDPEIGDGAFWVQALPSGRIRFLCPRMEMGQGATLGLSQVVAEELNVDQSDVECVLPDTDQTPPFKMTVGSEGIRDFFDPVSHGAARLREALRDLAAAKAGLPRDKIDHTDGGFLLPDGTTLTFAAIVPDRPVVVPPADDDGTVAPVRYAVERQGNYRAIGQPWRHQELEAIVTGTATYSRDVVVADMLYGAVVLPPVLGARLTGANVDAARAVPGVVATVVDKGANFVGVAAQDQFALAPALAAIEAHWDTPDALSQADIDGKLDVARFGGDFAHTVADAGDIGAAQNAAAFRVSARYDTAFVAHGAMEPRAATAWVRANRVEVWCGSQDPFFIQRRVAQVLGRAADDVVVHSQRMGGGFGGRVLCQPAEQAALLSVAAGQPVRVQWSREAELQQNYYQPGYSHLIDAGVSQDGAITYWTHDFVTSPILLGLVPRSIAWVVDRLVEDEGPARGSRPPYGVANQRIRHSAVRTPIPTGAWRGLGAAPNGFAIESMIDELAAAAGADPLALRLHNLPADQQRLGNVLREVAKMSGWGRPTPPDSALGLACAVYKGETPAAVVVEVGIDHTAKQIRVAQVWCAHDCGLMINPDQIEAQVMGNLAWGCSLALKERLTVVDGAIDESNFHTYSVLRHGDSPEMHIALLSPPGTPPVGAGESAIAPVAAAIANAVFRATGERLRRLPMSYGDLTGGAES